MKTHLVTALLLLSVGFARATTLSYLRFEESSGYGAYDETGLLNGEVLFGDVSPVGGIQVIAVGAPTFLPQQSLKPEKPIMDRFISGQAWLT